MNEEKKSEFPMRLQKFLAYCGVASRRKAEMLITSGQVQVNGAVETQLGTKVAETDVVIACGKVCTIEYKRYYVLNKPRGYLCTVSDDHGRKTIYDLIDDKSKLFSIGRLDFDSQGLIIVTNDGEFANEMAHPRHGVTKQYCVESAENVPADLVGAFLAGVVVENVQYKAIAATKDGAKRLLITLGEGKKREIRQVYKYFGLHIRKLERIKIGRMKLVDLGLRTGEYRQFSLENLKKMIF